ncbi:hypothetical protein [Variovorax sp. Root318D1]|nr:hypothetical protein [Variovorax sp. Root318D1]
MNSDASQNKPHGMKKKAPLRLVATWRFAALPLAAHAEQVV